MVVAAWQQCAGVSDWLRFSAPKSWPRRSLESILLAGKVTDWFICGNPTLLLINFTPLKIISMFSLKIISLTILNPKL